MKYELLHPGALEIVCPDGEPVMGGSQEWYPRRWERASGCGPTTASNLIWYLARSRPGQQTPCGASGNDKGRFVELMREMYALMPPGIGGVNKSTIFTAGIARYSKIHDAAMPPRVLEIPAKRYKRPDIDTVSNFIITALQSDVPVGFLNLASGTVRDLEAWHWVTIIGFDTEIMAAVVLDKGRTVAVSLDEWLQTSRLGGAMVYIDY